MYVCVHLIYVINVQTGFIAIRSHDTEKKQWFAVMLSEKGIRLACIHANKVARVTKHLNLPIDRYSLHYCHLRHHKGLNRL